jgi:hypothetical protein
MHRARLVFRVFAIAGVLLVGAGGYFNQAYAQASGCDEAAVCYVLNTLLQVCYVDGYYGFHHCNWHEDADGVLTCQTVEGFCS